MIKISVIGNGYWMLRDRVSQDSLLAIHDFAHKKGIKVGDALLDPSLYSDAAVYNSARKKINAWNEWEECRFAFCVERNTFMTISTKGRRFKRSTSVLDSSAMLFPLCQVNVEDPFLNEQFHPQGIFIAHRLLGHIFSIMLHTDNLEEIIWRLIPHHDPFFCGLLCDGVNFPAGDSPMIMDASIVGSMGMTCS